MYTNVPISPDGMGNAPVSAVLFIHNLLQLYKILFIIHVLLHVKALHTGRLVT